MRGMHKLHQGFCSLERCVRLLRAEHEGNILRTQTEDARRQGLHTNNVIFTVKRVCCVDAFCVCYQDKM